jgi:hypothetical protein
MLIKSAVLQRIRKGEVQLAFRRWARPTVKRGTLLRTALGVVAIDEVSHVEARSISDAEAKLAGYSGRSELIASLRGEGALYRIALHFEGPDPRVALRAQRLTSEDERRQVLAKLDALDRRARGGPFTRRFLALIEQSPGVAAAALARTCGMEVFSFKAQVRKLKELGLTESLEVGYRLSERGRDVLGPDAA